MTKTIGFAVFVLSVVVLPLFGGDQVPSPAAPSPKDAQALVTMATKSTDTAVPGPGTPDSSVPGFQNRNPRYELRPNDVIDISFSYTPELNQAVTVQPDGFITLAQIGDVEVAGQTVDQLRQTLKVAYSKILRDPVFSVTLKEFEKPYLTVFGQVHNPGKLELRGATTVIGAIGAAGGFSESAKHSQVILFRRVSSQWIRVRVLNVKQMLNRGDLTEDTLVEPNDLIYVPKNTVSKIRPWIPYYGFGLSVSQNSSF